MENRRIHPSIVTVLLQSKVWVPDDENLTDNQRRKNETLKEVGVSWWPAILKAVRSKKRADFSSKEKNRAMANLLLSRLIKHQDTGYYYFYPEYYNEHKLLCFEFFGAWQRNINSTRRKKDGWSWHWVDVGDHRIKMMEIK